jgi:hypothetical protein
VTVSWNIETEVPQRLAALLRREGVGVELGAVAGCNDDFLSLPAVAPGIEHVQVPVSRVLANETGVT